MICRSPTWESGKCTHHPPPYYSWKIDSCSSTAFQPWLTPLFWRNEYFSKMARNANQSVQRHMLRTFPTYEEPASSSVSPSGPLKTRPETAKTHQLGQSSQMATKKILPRDTSKKLNTGHLPSFCGCRLLLEKNRAERGSPLGPPGEVSKRRWHSRGNSTAGAQVMAATRRNDGRKRRKWRK